jgi:hypothetical protein
MKSILFLSLVIISFSLRAQYEPKFNVYVHSLDDDIDLSPLKRPEYIKVNGVGDNRKNANIQIPSVSVMNELFKQANLKVQTDQMDQLDRDIFYRKLKERDLASIESSYPQFDRSELKRLKQLIEESK